MNSFGNMGAMGAANVATVARGMAVAVVATAIGLMAAIPAVMAYNFFSRRIRVISSEIGHITGNCLLADHDYRRHIALSEGHIVLPQPQLLAQLLRFTRERGRHRRVGARANQGHATRNRRRRRARDRRGGI